MIRPKMIALGVFGKLEWVILTISFKKVGPPSILREKIYAYPQKTGRMKLLKFTVAILFLAAVSSCSYKTCPTYSKIEAPTNLTVSTQPVGEVSPAQ